MWYSIFLTKGPYDQKVVFNDKATKKRAEAMFNEVVSVAKPGERVLLFSGKNIGRLLKEETV